MTAVTARVARLRIRPHPGPRGQVAPAPEPRASRPRAWCRAIMKRARRASPRSSSPFMRAWMKVALIVAGYVGSFMAASAVVAAHVYWTWADRQGSDGMYAFGDSLFFLAAFGLASIP